MSWRAGAIWWLTWLVVLSISCGGGAGTARSEALRPEASRTTGLVSTHLRGPECALLSAGSDEAAESLQRCPGVAGYHLLVLDADSRMTVSVVEPGGEQFPLEYAQVISPCFSQLGPAALWWQGGSGLALAVPVLANEDAEDPEQVSRYWAIAKVSRSGACVTERLAAGALETGTAERVTAALAAAPQRPCRLPSTPSPRAP